MTLRHSAQLLRHGFRSSASEDELGQIKKGEQDKEPPFDNRAQKKEKKKRNRGQKVNEKKRLAAR